MAAQDERMDLPVQLLEIDVPLPLSAGSSEDEGGVGVANLGIIIALCAVAALIGSAAIYTLGVVVTKSSMPVPSPLAPVPPPPGVRDAIAAPPSQANSHSSAEQGPPVTIEGSVRSDGGEGGIDETAAKKEDGFETPVLIEALGDPSTTTTTTTRMKLWKKVAGVAAVGAVAGAGYSLYQQHAAFQAGADRSAYTPSCIVIGGRLHRVLSDENGDVVASQEDRDCAGHDDGGLSRTASACLTATVCCLMLGAATLSLTLGRQRKREHSAIQLAGAMFA